MNSNIYAALERISSKDKDFRYMGTSDLYAELNKDTFKVDSETEKRVCHAVVHQLDDASGDISALAVKCLVPLVRHVNEAKVVEIGNALITKLVRGKEQQRDIATIALKTIIADVPAGPSAAALAALLPGKLTAAIAAPEVSTEVKGEALDVLHEVLQRFGTGGGGANAVREQEKLLAVLLDQLTASTSRAALRKKAIHCLACLAVSMPDELLARATKNVVSQLKSSVAVKPDILRTNIQMVGALGRAVGYRFGPYLGEVLPIMVQYCKQAAENDEDTREYSLQALETFVLRCPADVAPFCGTVLDVALEFVAYDPNFTDDAAADDDSAMDEDADGDADEEEEEDDADEDYSDDEDMSWKVRRAAAKCISALATSRPEMLTSLYQKAVPKLIERFREREESVKVDVFGTFIDLLKHTGHAHSAAVTPGSPQALLQEDVPRLVRALNRQLKEKSLKTKVGVFSVLKELVKVVPASVNTHTPQLVPGLCKALTDKHPSNSNLKIEALLFARLLLLTTPSSTFHAHINELVPPVAACVGDRYYKVTSEALRVCGEIVTVVRPSVALSLSGQQQAAAGEATASDAAAASTDMVDTLPFVPALYKAVLSRLTAQDQDQEVKECAIMACALLLSHLGDSLSADERAAALKVLLDRLRNDITRLAAVKAFRMIAASPLRLDLSSLLEPVVLDLTSFLRKANRALRQASMSTLTSLVSAYTAGVSYESYVGIVTELCPLVSDADLAMAASALELCCTVLAAAGPLHPGLSAIVTERVQPRALDLVKSPLLQGNALLMLQRFFAQQVQQEHASFEQLLEQLLACGSRVAVAPTSSAAAAAAAAAGSGGGVNRAAFASIAQCAAVLCIAAGPEKCAVTVKRLHQSLQQQQQQQQQQQGTALLPLLTLGEIGRRADLSAHSGLEAVVMAAFASPSEDVKSAASFCLGSLAAGNPGEYLPIILSRIGSDRQQYLLLLALKEVIASGSGAEAAAAEAAGAHKLVAADVGKVLALLLVHSESEEDGVRSVVAECLGKLLLIDPPAVVSALEERARSPSAYTRATAATALKFALPDADSTTDAYLKPRIATFLRLLGDQDRHVRRAAVLALSTAAHSKPSLVEDLLPELLPLLYDQMLVKKELVRTLDLGPFKHVVDDGLELRKAAFDCLDTLISTCFHRLHPAAFLTPYLLSGLSDTYDVKMPCHLILARLAVKSGPTVLAVLDALLDPLEKTLSARVKSDAVKQETDRNDDMVRSALRAVDAIQHIPNVESSLRFKAFMANILRLPNVVALYNAVKHEQQQLLLQQQQQQQQQHH